MCPLIKQERQSDSPANRCAFQFAVVYFGSPAQPVYENRLVNKPVFSNHCWSWLVLCVRVCVLRVCMCVYVVYVCVCVQMRSNPCTNGRECAVHVYVAIAWNATHVCNRRPVHLWVRARKYTACYGCIKTKPANCRLEYTIYEWVKRGNHQHRIQYRSRYEQDKR